MWNLALSQTNLKTGAGINLHGTEQVPAHQMGDSARHYLQKQTSKQKHQQQTKRTKTNSS